VRGRAEDVKASVDLVALVGSRVELRKSGSQFVGPCPFHDDRTPSFYVHPERGFYCHGCGAKGDAIGFLMRLDGLDFAQALEQLSGAPIDGPGKGPSNAAPKIEAPARDAAALWARLSGREREVVVPGLEMLGHGADRESVDVRPFVAAFVLFSLPRTKPVDHHPEPPTEEGIEN
jgi:hypothetical protein